MYGHMCSTYYTSFVNLSLMKIEMKINEISSKVLSKVKSTFLSTIEFENNIGRLLREWEETFIMVCMGLVLDSL